MKMSTAAQSAAKAHRRETLLIAKQLSENTRFRIPYGGAFAGVHTIHVRYWTGTHSSSMATTLAWCSNSEPYRAGLPLRFASSVRTPLAHSEMGWSSKAERSKSSSTNLKSCGAPVERSVKTCTQSDLFSVSITTNDQQKSRNRALTRVCRATRRPFSFAVQAASQPIPIFVIHWC